MNTYRFVFQFATVTVQAASLGAAYEILSRENFMPEQKLRTVECESGTRRSLADYLSEKAVPAVAEAIGA